jgi:orotate phosphoribosyltransferase
MTQRLDLLAESRVRLARDTALTELRADIMRVAYLTGDFELSRGLRRSYYFDKYAFQTRPAILRRLGRFLADLVPRDTDRLAAAALGAVALGTAVSLELGLPLVIVRPEVEPGSGRPFEGELYADEGITLVEDVVVVGDRALGAVAQLRRAGARVTHIVAVLDRREGATNRFAEESIEYRPLLTPEDLGIE